MWIKLAATAAVTAVALSAASLSVSLTHAGPQGRSGSRGPVGKTGPQGPAGDAGQSAVADHLGVCITYYTTYYGMSSTTLVQSVNSPLLTNGVASCPSGSFVPVTPQS